MEDYRRIHYLARKFDIDKFEEVMLSGKYKTILTIDNLEKDMEKASRASVEIIKLPSRFDAIVVPRQVMQSLMVICLGYELSTTGLYFKQNHATVINSIKKVWGYVSTNDEIIESYKPLFDKYNYHELIEEKYKI